MRQKKTVLFYIKDPNGGTGRYLEQIYQAFQGNSHFKIAIVTHTPAFNYRFSSQQIGKPIAKQCGISIYNLMLIFWNLLSVSKYVLTTKPDIIVSLDVYANLTTNLIGLLFFKLPIINSSHVNIQRHISNDRKGYFAALLKYCISILYKRGDLHIVPSHGLREELIVSFSLSEKKVIRIPYFVDSSFIKKQAVIKIKDKMIRNHFKHDDIKIITIVRNDSQKDISTLIQSCCLVSQNLYMKNVKLIVLGIQSIIGCKISDTEKEFLTKNTLFLGWQNNPYKFLSHSDVFVLVSRFEGFSYAILECQILGIPVISSDVDYGPRELIRDRKSGILIDRNDPDIFAKEIINVIDNKKFRNSLIRQALNQSKKFDKSQILSTYSELFKSICDCPH